MPDTLSLLWTISWQTAILTAIIWLTTRLARKAPASWRCALWALVLVKLIIPPFAYLPENIAVWQNSAPVSVSTTQSPRRQLIAPEPAAMDTQPTVAAPITAPEPTRAPSIPAILTALWLLGACIAASTLLLRILTQRRIIRQALPINVATDAILSTCASSLNIKRIPMLLQSTHATTPMLLGIIKPTILLPMGLADTCPEPEMQAILLHELAHIKRHDMLTLWLQHLVQIAFYFNPALWLTARELKRERELACDELVLSTQTITRQAYAAGYLSALKMAAATPSTPISLAMAEPFEIEKRRLQMILSNSAPKLTLRLALTATVIAVLGLPTFAGLATNAPQTPSEIFAKMAEGRARLAAQIQSGKGDIRYYLSVASGPKHDIRMASATIKLAFLGERYAMAVNDARGGIARTAGAYDGQNLRFIQADKAVASTLRGSFNESFPYTDFARMPAMAYPDIASIPLSWGHDPGQVEIKTGWKTQQGIECIVIESKLDTKQDNGERRIDTWQFYLDPARDYIICQTNHSFKNPDPGESDRLVIQEFYYKQHGDTWLPRAFAQTTLVTDATTGRKYVSEREVYQCDKSFAINAPVTEADLQLPQLSPKPAPTRPTPPHAKPGPAPAPKPAPTPEPKPTPTPEPSISLQIPTGGRVSRRFLPKPETLTLASALHTGVDIIARNGTPIQAAGDGKVIKSGWQGAYGYTVILAHSEGVTTHYSHCSKKLAVTAGQEVKKGDIIAYVGSTGYATGPHLHYEKRINGVPVDPLKP